MLQIQLKSDLLKYNIVPSPWAQICCVIDNNAFNYYHAYENRKLNWTKLYTVPWG